MAKPSRIPTPFPLLVRRFHIQAVPIITVVGAALIASWLWVSHAHSAFATGEVDAVRVHIESKNDGILDELPKPVNLFDSVKAGQVVARLDTSAAEAELRRLEQELSQLPDNIAATTLTTGPATAPAVMRANPVLEWYHARIDQLHTKIKDKDLKSPINGTIVEIHRRPGEGAEGNKTILTIAADRGDFIVGYVRQDQGVRPVQGMSVEVRSRTRPSATYHSTVQSVGPQIEKIPARHWQNPKVAEWALPIQVALPKDADLRPGELVDLVLKPISR